MSAGRPSWWTGMIALVRGVMARSAASGSRLNVRGSTSAKTGVAPHCQTELAVAMNDIDGTITSSPGPTPATCSASCSAVVQFETATASAAPTRSAKARLELAHARALGDPTRGDDLGDRVALVAAQGTAGERDSHHDASASMRVGCVGAPARSPRHHSTSRVRPSSRSTSASKPSSLAGDVGAGQAAGDAVDGALGPVLDGEVGVHHLEQHLGQPEQAGLDAAGDVVDHVGAARLRRRACSPARCRPCR